MEEPSDSEVSDSSRRVVPNDTKSSDGPEEREFSIIDEIYEMLTKPETSRAALIFFITINLCVITTLIMMTIESFPPYREADYSVFLIMEMIFNGIFTFEYGLKLLLAPFASWEALVDFETEFGETVTMRGFVVSRDDNHIYAMSALKVVFFLTDFPNIVDLVAILPTYVGFVTEQSVSFQFIKVLRLARGIRVFKFIKRKGSRQEVTTVFFKALPNMIDLVVFFLLLVFTGACALFAFEGGSYDEESGQYLRQGTYANTKEPSPFKNIFDAIYYVCVAILGSIQIGPTTIGGRTTAIILTFAVYVMFAMFMAMMGGTYMEHIFKGRAETAEFREFVREELEISAKRMLSIEKKVREVNSLLSTIINDSDIPVDVPPENTGNKLTRFILRKSKLKEDRQSPSPENTP